MQREDAHATHDSLALPAAVIDARKRPMAERLELALSWNALAVELRAGLTQTLARARRERE